MEVAYLERTTGLPNSLASLVFQFAPFDYLLGRFHIFLNAFCEGGIRAQRIDDPDGYALTISEPDKRYGPKPRDMLEICLHLRPGGESVWFEWRDVLCTKIYTNKLFWGEAAPGAEIEKLVRIYKMLLHNIESYSP